MKAECSNAAAGVQTALARRAQHRKGDRIMSFKSLIPWNKQNRKNEMTPARRQQFESDPFALLQHEMNRVFDIFHGDFDGFGAQGGAAWMPLVNVSESEKEVKVSAELPGLEEKDIDVTLADNVLTIKGEKKAEHEEQDGNYHRVERSYGSFVRAIPMPVDVVADKVGAAFAKGVLTVTLPKSPEAQQSVKRIAVKAS
jgi:HSP20 family protein